MQAQIPHSTAAELRLGPTKQVTRAPLQRIMTSSPTPEPVEHSTSRRASWSSDKSDLSSVSTAPTSVSGATVGPSDDKQAETAVNRKHAGPSCLFKPLGHSNKALKRAISPALSTTSTASSFSSRQAKSRRSQVARLRHFQADALKKVIQSGRLNANCYSDSQVANIMESARRKFGPLPPLVKVKGVQKPRVDKSFVLRNVNVNHELSDVALKALQKSLAAKVAAANAHEK